MAITPRKLINMALEVQTRAEFEQLAHALRDAGARYERPVGDLAGNLSAISASGDPEHLVLELVTNGQDALLERAAAAIRQPGGTPPQNPRTLAEMIGWPGDARANQEIAQQLELVLRESGDRARPTITVRDTGIGIDAAHARNSIFSLMQAPKNHAPYLLGNYGKGGSTMYRDGRGAVVVGRPSPELIAERGCEDRVWVSVVDAVHDNGKVDRWTYLVTSEFDADRPGQSGPLLSFDASEVDFEPGVFITHVAYLAPGIGTAKILRDRRSIYVLGNTRLFDPVLPWTIRDERPDAAHTGYRAMYGSKRTFLGSEQRQLKSSPLEGGELPVRDPDSSAVYQLPITVFLFDKQSRWSATAGDHVVVFTANGQVQAHWGATETRIRTAEASGTLSGLRRVASDAMFAEVNLDGLPPRVRSRVVSADRTRFTDVPVAKAIESEVSRWLAEQAVLQELEKELSLERSRSVGQAAIRSKTLDEIARKLGFTGSGGPRPRKPRPPKPPIVLLDEPTELSGSETVSLVMDRTRTIHFSLNATDGFLVRQVGEFELELDGLVLANTPVATSLRSGRFSTEVLVGSDANPGRYPATARITFLARAGGRKVLEWPFKIDLLDEPIPPRESLGRKSRGSRPVVVWEELDSSIVGDVTDEFTGEDLAELYSTPEYLKLGDQRVTLIQVNKNYLTFRQYLDQVADAYSDQTVASREDRYVVGAAVALSKVLGVIPGAKDDPFPSVENGERQEILKLSADAVVASLPQVEQV